MNSFTKTMLNALTVKFMMLLAAMTLLGAPQALAQNTV